MLEIKKLTVEVDSKKILDDVSLGFDIGKTYFLLGKNGSGKSSLALSIAGHPKYKVKNGEIILDSFALNGLSPNERSNLGIFLSFQSIPEIPGIRLGEFLRTIYNFSKKSKNESEKDVSPFLFSRFIKKHLEDLKIPESFLSRDLNVGFSGGEKRKIELLQIKLLSPKFVILDEIDSGLDIDAFKVVARNLAEMKTDEMTLIFITHNFNLMDYIHVDKVYVLEKGKLIDSGDKSLIEKIKRHGYCDYCDVNKEKCEIENKCA